MIISNERQKEVSYTQKDDNTLILKKYEAF